MNRSRERHRGRRDQAARAPWVAIVEAGEATCRACGDPIDPDQAWDLGHDEDLQAGGHPAGARSPEHALRDDCKAGGNRARGSRAMHDRRAGRRRRLDEWLE